MISVSIILICLANVKYKLDAYSVVDTADAAILLLSFISLLTGWS